jgi:hypothetical protein
MPHSVPHRLLTHQAVCDRHDSHKREPRSEDRVGPAGLMREARNDPPDRNAGCKRRQPRPPPRQVGSLIRQMRPPRRVARLVELTAAGRTDVRRRAHGGDYTGGREPRPNRDSPSEKYPPLLLVCGRPGVRPLAMSSRAPAWLLSAGRGSAPTSLRHVWTSCDSGTPMSSSCLLWRKTGDLPRPLRVAPPGTTEQSTRRCGDAPPGYIQQRRGHGPRRHREFRANHQPPGCKRLQPESDSPAQLARVAPGLARSREGRRRSGRQRTTRCAQSQASGYRRPRDRFCCLPPRLARSGWRLSSSLPRLRTVGRATGRSVPADD